jgi:macrophage erythroblast attacher
MLARMQNLKRKMESIQQEEKKIQNQSRKRIQHLEHLHQIPSLADVKYDQWSRIRLDRLVVDHMLRSGYTESAQQLAQEKGIEDLVDLDVFVQCQRIAQSLRRGETKDALQWCNENKAALKKSQVCGVHMNIAVSRIQSHLLTNQTQFNLEFELRLQQYIEMLRTGDRGKLMDAMSHAKRYLTPYTETQSKEIHRAAGLLAFPQDTKAEPYKVHPSNLCRQIRPLSLKNPANRFSVNVLIRSVESPV